MEDKIIVTVCGKPELYDSTNYIYRDKFRKDLAWRRVSEETGVAEGSWPADEGKWPAPRQKKWYELYQRIEKCPMMQHGQKSLFGGVRRCLCGFHIQK
ncbi:hypothetical protein ATANTOWER_030080, partial [Ataeniobius toweri]|nr:hypothetical protein [Ataeniobius toweri]